MWTKHSSLFGALVLFVLSLTATVVVAQSRPSTQVGAKPSESKAPVAQYDIGAIVKKLAALEAQVAELRKRNDALEGQIKKMQVQIGNMNVSLNAASKQVGQTADPLKTELQRLDNALRNHTHSINVGIMALSAIPGMQDIANKCGAGYAVQQWQTMKMLWSPGNGPGQTGTATIPQE